MEDKMKAINNSAVAIGFDRNSSQLARATVRLTGENASPMTYVYPAIKQGAPSLAAEYAEAAQWLDRFNADDVHGATMLMSIGDAVTVFECRGRGKKTGDYQAAANGIVARMVKNGYVDEQQGGIVASALATFTQKLVAYANAGRYYTLIKRTSGEYGELSGKQCRAAKMADGASVTFDENGKAHFINADGKDIQIDCDFNLFRGEHKVIQRGSHFFVKKDKAMRSAKDLLVFGTADDDFGADKPNGDSLVTALNGLIRHSPKSEKAVATDNAAAY